MKLTNHWSLMLIYDCLYCWSYGWETWPLIQWLPLLLIIWLGDLTFDPMVAFIVDHMVGRHDLLIYGCLYCLSYGLEIWPLICGCLYCWSYGWEMWPLIIWLPLLLIIWLEDDLLIYGCLYCWSHGWEMWPLILWFPLLLIIWLGDVTFDLWLPLLFCNVTFSVWSTYTSWNDN